MRKLASLLCLVLSSPSLAADCVWIGVDGLWSTPTNWTCGRTPQPADTVLIEAGAVSLDMSVKIAGLQVRGSSATLSSEPGLDIEADSISIVSGKLLISDCNLVARDIEFSDGALFRLQRSSATVSEIRGSNCRPPMGFEIIDGSELTVDSRLWFSPPMGMRIGSPGSSTTIRFRGPSTSIESPNRIIMMPAGDTSFEVLDGGILTIGSGVVIEARSGPVRLHTKEGATTRLEGRLSSYNEESPIVIGGSFESFGLIEARSVGRIRFLNPNSTFDGEVLHSGSWLVQEVGTIEAPDGFDVREIGPNATVVLRENTTAPQYIRHLRRLDGWLTTQGDFNIHPDGGQLAVVGSWRMELGTRVTVTGDLAGPPPGTSPFMKLRDRRGILAQVSQRDPGRSSTIDVKGTADLSNLRVVGMGLMGSGTLNCGATFRPLTFERSRGEPLQPVFIDSCGCAITTDATSVISTITSRADFDRNGVVDDQDFLFFAEAFDQGCGCGPYIIANFNGVTGMDDDDFGFFAAAYDVAICP